MFFFAPGNYHSMTVTTQLKKMVVDRKTDRQTDRKTDRKTDRSIAQEVLAVR